MNKPRLSYCILTLLLIVSISTGSLAQDDSDSSEEESVDLDALEDEDTSTTHPGGHPGSGAGDDHKKPFKFKLFFDLLMEYEWETETFQFTRDHAYVVLELNAADWLSFRTDIAFEPSFFELTFHLGTVFEVRLGKILIPFGQNEFHHLIGGRVDRQSLFLPLIWADYGLALKHMAYNGDIFGFDYTIYAVNGFQQTIGMEGTPEPSRNAGSLTDNNTMKGIGLRMLFRIGAVNIGASGYFDAWDDDNQQQMLYYGLDLELGYGLMPAPVLRNIRLRGEIASGEVMLPDLNLLGGILKYATRKSGYNLEISYRVIRWLTVRFREGYLNADSRVADTNDLRIHEPAVDVIYGPVKFSLILQIHEILPAYTETAPEDYSCVFARVMFRY